MAVTPLTAAEISTMLAKFKRGMIGNGKSVHLAKGNQSLCGKFIDAFLETSEAKDAPVCKRCMITAEKNYRMDRKISYGCMRDAELDRQTWGGKPFTQAEEEKEIAAYMEYAGRTTDADIAILTADGFVECTPEILAEALTELATPVGKWDAAFAEYADKESAEYTAALPELVDTMEMADTMDEPLIVEALLSVHMDGVTVSLGWKTITVPAGSEKSLATLYAEQSGSTWHRVGAPKWDSIITVMESYV